MVGGFAGSLAYTHPYRSNLACSIALDAVSTVVFEENGHKEIDIKQYAKVEKVGGNRLVSLKAHQSDSRRRD